MSIHPTAVVDPRAEIHPDAELGPYVVIEGPVRVGARTRVQSHVTLMGFTEIGADNVIHSGAVIGDTPQDLSFSAATESYVRLGDRNVIRELVQIHRGTKEGTATILGDDNYLMAHAHIGHNCSVGNNVILANGSMLGGYVEVADRVFISGNCTVHQFVRIGRVALLGGLGRAARDVPPFCIMDGTHTVRTINRIGLRRAGFDARQIGAVHAAFRALFFVQGNLRRAMAKVEEGECSAEVRELLDFIRASTRGVCRGARRAGADQDE